MAKVSTTAPLAANAIYRPAAPIDTGGSAVRLRVLVSADQAGQLGVEQSDDNATWYCTLGPQAIIAIADFAGNHVGAVYESLVTLRYVRPVYVNGATPQGRFVLMANTIEV